MNLFVSYSRADQSFVLRLVADLRDKGMPLWLDAHDISAGDAWDDAIERALKGSSAVIVILSNESVRSKSVMDEVSYALEENKVVLPVLLMPCQIPFRLRRLQYVDFTKSYELGVALLVDAIRRRVLQSTPVLIAESAAEMSPPIETIITVRFPPLRIPPDKPIDLNDLAGVVSGKAARRSSMLNRRIRGSVVVAVAGTLVSSGLTWVAEVPLQASVITAVGVGGVVFIIGFFGTRERSAVEPNANLAIRQ